MRRKWKYALLPMALIACVAVGCVEQNGQSIWDDEVEIEEEVKTDDEVKIEEEVKSDDEVKIEEEVKTDDEVKTEEEVKTDDEVETEEEVKSDDEVKIEEEIPVPTPTPTEYTVYFDGLSECITVTEEGTYGALPTPSKVGYTFVGWYTAEVDGTLIQEGDKVAIIQDTTLYARWSAKTFTVHFAYNDGTETSVVQIQTFDSSYLLPNEPTRTGYAFTGWFTQATGGVQITDEDVFAIAQDGLVVYAQWQATCYTLHFDGLDESVTVTYDGTYGELPTPSKVGYTFVGWYTAETGGTLIQEGDKVAITQDTTLYAHWSAAQYTVFFDGNGGCVDVESMSVTYTTAYGELPTPKRAGYLFGGWISEEHDQVTEESIVTIAASHTLTATWTEQPTTYFTREQYTSAAQTYDFTTAYTSIGNATAIFASDIPNAAVREAIADDARFGETLMRIDGSSTFTLTAFTGNEDLFSVGYTYYLTVHYYAVRCAVTDGYVSNLYASGGERQAYGAFASGLQTTTFIYTVADGDNALAFVGDDLDIYVGSITITAKEPTSLAPSYYAVTDEDMLISDGYTYDWSENNFLQLSNSSAYVEIERLADGALVKSLLDTGAYANGVALQYASTSDTAAYFIDMPDLTDGYEYTLTFTAYIVNGIETFSFLPTSERNGGSQVNSLVYAIDWTYDEESGMYTGVLRFTPPTGAVGLQMCSQGCVEAYFASIRFQKEIHFGGASGLEGGVYFDAHELNADGKGSAVSVPSQYWGNTGVYGDYALQYGVSVSSSTTFIDISALTSGATTTQVTYFYWVEKKFTGLYAKLDSKYLSLATTVGWHAETVTFTGSGSALGIFETIANNGGTSGTLYLCSVYIVTT